MMHWRAKAAVKTDNRKFRADAARAAQTARVFFFCGQDEAGASAAAGQIVEMLPDAGERVEITGADLKADPARLGDEARSNSLFGGTRHIWARVQGEEALEPLRALIETGEAGGGDACPVIVIATGATDKSRTAKLLEKRADALVAHFWPPDLRSVTASVRAMGDAAGLRLDDALAQRIASGALMDVRLARSETDKLALYIDASPQSPRTVQAADLDAIGAVSEEDGFADLVNTVLSGKARQLPDELRRMHEVSMNPVGLLLAIERRVAQLVKIRAKLGAGGTVDRLSYGEQASLGIFKRDKADITVQLRKWHSRNLPRLVERVAALHRELLTNSRDAELLLAQGLTGITRVAARS